MANPSIGGITVLTMNGQAPQDPKTDVADITRNGADGHAWIDIAKRGDQVTVQTEADVSSPATTRAAYRALKGTLVSVVLPDSDTIDLVMVLAVMPGMAKKCLLPQGGLVAGSWILPCTWVLKGTKVT